MDNSNDDFIFKFLVIGDSGVGKSTFIHQYIHNKYKQDQTQTIGVDFLSKPILISNKKIKLQIWDTAGQEKYRSMIKNYYRGAIGVVILYDITKNETFQHAISWLNDARSLSRKESSICLVGNKLDLRKQRQVELVSASEFSQENGIFHFETSAFTGENVEEVFVCLSKQIISKVQSGIIDSSSVSVFGQYKKMIMNNSKEENESKKNEYKCGC